MCCSLASALRDEHLRYAHAGLHGMHLCKYAAGSSGTVLWCLMHHMHAHALHNKQLLLDLLLD